MYKYFLLIALILCSFSVSAQWQQTGSKVRYVTGIGIPTKDTAAGVAADSSQILIRPADSSLYVKYKRTWMRVGGGGGSIAGSGTTNYIPKFTSSSAIGNSQIFDNGTRVGIGYGGASAYKFGVQFSQSSNTVDGFILTSSTLSKSYAIWAANAIGGSLWGLSNPYTGFINYTSGDATSYINDGGGYFSWHNSTAELMRLTNAGNVGLGTITPTAKFDVNGVIKNNDRILANANNANGTAAINTFFNNSTIAQFCNFTNVASATQYGYMQGSDGTNYIAGSKNVFEYGNVGIGTASPESILHIAKGNSAGLGAQLVIDNTASTAVGNAVEISFLTDAGASGTGTRNARIRAVNENVGNGAANMQFWTWSGSTDAERMRITSGGNTLIGTTTDNGTDKLQVNGSTISTQFKLSALNTAPASATATGTTGEIRIDANYIYICTATNTWKRVAIATW